MAMVTLSKRQLLRAKAIRKEEQVYNTVTATAPCSDPTNRSTVQRTNTPHSKINSSNSLFKTRTQGLTLMRLTLSKSLVLSWMSKSGLLPTWRACKLRDKAILHLRTFPLRSSWGITQRFSLKIKIISKMTAKLIRGDLQTRNLQTFLSTRFKISKISQAPNFNSLLSEMDRAKVTMLWMMINLTTINRMLQCKN